MDDLNRPTARERTITALQQHPEGLSFNRLLKEVGGNTNVLRKAVAKLIRDGYVKIEAERTIHGETLIHTLIRPEERGQLTISDLPGPTVTPHGSGIVIVGGGQATYGLDCDEDDAA